MSLGDQLWHLAEEERHEQRRDMRTVDIGIGHHDDALIAQLVFLIAIARAAAERKGEVRELLIGAQPVARRRGDIEDLAAQRKDRLGLALACLLGRAAGAVAFDEKNLRAFGIRAAAIGKLAGQSQLARGGFALEIALLLAARAILRALDDGIEQGARALRVFRKPMVEAILERALDEPCRFLRGQALFGLALKLWVANEERQDDDRAFHHILGRNLLRAP